MSLLSFTPSLILKQRRVRKLTRLGQSLVIVVLAYTLIWNKELPKVVAATTDCSTNLDQADTVYQLTGNTVGNCIITANNITIDGQGLYSVNGNISANDDGNSFVVTDVVNVTGRVYGYGSGDITIINSVVDRVRAYNEYGPSRNIYITDSVIDGNTDGYGYVRSLSGIADAGGDVTITRSSLQDYVRGNAITITDNSTVGSYVNAQSNITIADSEITGRVSLNDSIGGSEITITDSVLGDQVSSQSDSGDTGNVTITRTTIAGSPCSEDICGIISNAFSATGDITITESEVNGIVTSFSQTINQEGSVIINNSTINDNVSGPSISITDSSTITGRITGTIEIIVADSEITGEVRLNITNEGGDINITDSVLHDQVLATISGSGEGSPGDITITRTSVAGHDGGESTYGVYSFANNQGRNITITESQVTGLIRSQSAAHLYGDIFITDSAITGSVDGNTLTLIDNPPSLIVTPLEVDIAIKETFDNNFGTIEANDIKDGDLTADIIVTGSVDAPLGIYELEYSVTDRGTDLYFNNIATSTGQNTTTVTRTITRSENDNDSGTSAAGRAARLAKHSKDESKNEEVTIVPEPSLKEALEQLQSSLDAIFTMYYLVTGEKFVPLEIKDLSYGDIGPEVKALQHLLISLGYSIPDGETGFFGTQTRDALRRYQLINNITPAKGYFGPKSRAELWLTGRGWW